MDYRLYVMFLYCSQCVSTVVSFIMKCICACSICHAQHVCSSISQCLICIYMSNSGTPVPEGVFFTFICQPFSFEYCCQVVTPNVPDIQVIPPEDEHLRHIIDTTAMYVLDDGCTFEQAVMERGRGNPLFNFLFDLTSREHTYYIWRLYSFAQVRTQSCAYFTTSASCNVCK
jgi:hypothetical protein